MILITGATGNIGGEVVRQFQALPTTHRLPLRAVVRNPVKATRLVESGVEVMQGDFADIESLRRVLTEIDHVFLTVPEGQTQFDMMQNFLDAANQTSNPHLVMLSGAEPAEDSPRIISRWHWRMQQQILASGLPYTFLQPVYIMQNVLQYLGPIQQHGQFFAAIGGDVPFTMVSPQDIAASAVAALTQPGHEGQQYVLTGAETLTFNKVAETLEATLKRDVKYVQAPRETIIAQLIANGFADWLAEAFVSMLPPSNVMTDNVGKLTGKAPLTLAQYIQTAAAPLR